jgi:hypothetical protein
MEQKSTIIKLSENFASGLTVLVIFGLFYRGLTAYQNATKSSVFQKTVKAKLM